MAKLTTVWRQLAGSNLILWMIVVVVALLAAYWNDLSVVGTFWDNPEYSHGYLIPLFAFVLLGQRRRASQSLTDRSHKPDPTDAGYSAIFMKVLRGRPVEVAGGALLALSALLIFLAECVFDATAYKYSVLLTGLCVGLAGGLLVVRPDFTIPEVTPGRWWGVGLLAAACAVRLWSTWHFATWPSQYSFVVAMAGLFLMVYGWTGLQWSWPSIGLLLLLFPFPDPIRRASLEPLQSIATQSSTYLLQTIGIAAYCTGNQISIGDSAVPLSVVEQCSGLRMLTIFLSLTIVIALFMQRPLWERLVVVVSSAPIALSVNVLRITVTGVMYQLAENGISIFGIPFTKEFADHLFHDWAGLFMPPVALLLLYVELRTLPRIFIEIEDSELSVPEFVAPRREREREPVSARG
jgi:exosortase